MRDCKENIKTCKWRRMLENKNRQADNKTYYKRKILQNFQNPSD
jgi:hypothetical protein